MEETLNRLLELNEVLVQRLEELHAKQTKLKEQRAKNEQLLQKLKFLDAEYPISNLEGQKNTEPPE